MARCLAATVALLALVRDAAAVVPSGRVAFQLHHQATPHFAELLGSPSFAAGWGVPLPEIQNARWKHVHMQARDARDPGGCFPYALPSYAPPHGLAADPYKTLVVVDRGNCSFLDKTLRAIAAGANGVIVRGTKRAVYDAIHAANKTNATATVDDASSPPLPPFEYDCANGEAFVARKAEPAWATDDAACAANAKCASRGCVLTGHEDTSRGGFQVCCLWDTAILMGAGNRTLAQNVSVPVVYLTIVDGQRLERTWTKYPQVLVRTFARDVPFFDVSSILLWALGVATAVGAAYYSAAYERECFRLRTDPEYAAQRLREQQTDPRYQHQHHGDALSDHHEHAWEIDGKTAIGFIAGAALFLTIFYYVKITQLLPLLFAFSATATFTQLVTAPLLHAAVPAVASRQCFVPLVNETWPLAELLGLACSAALAALWFAFRRSAWYLQDVFGVTLCFVFLRTVQLPTLKVATLLLTLAFCYDVFFVFISPLVFGSSVMEDVATGGPAAYTRSDYPGVDYCERYPSYPPCVDPEPMPMLLVLPRVFNWLGGVSMLGLGDIILPGLLLSFALRFDYSPQAVGYEHYFRTCCIGYAVGLAMANLAVTITQLGQPALMYLVPTCLGSLVVRAKANADFEAMWRGLGPQESDADKRHDGDEPSAMATSAAATTAAMGPSDVAVVVNDAGGAHDQAPLLGGGRASPR